MQTVDLTDHFLIAMPAMADSFFSKTLTYICEHSEQGALGLVVNRPIDLTLKELFDQLGITSDDQALGSHPIMFGGPIHWIGALYCTGRRGMAINHGGESGHRAYYIAGYFGAIANGGSPKQLLVALGYSGWAPGQIEHELSAKCLAHGPGIFRCYFELPSEERLTAAMHLLGIDFLPFRMKWDTPES